MLQFNHRLTSLFTVVALGALLFAGCAKEEPAPEEEEPTTTGSSKFGDFKWTPQGGNTVTADSARFIPGFTNIVAYKGGQSVDIILSSLSPGTYSISSSQGNTLEYYNGTTTYAGTTGNVVISSNSGSKISGQFNSGLSGGTLTAISGQFTDIPRR